jgi:hypothetical protein
MNDKESLIRRAFELGFLISREGFNGEYTYDPLAPTNTIPSDDDYRSFIENTKYQGNYKRLEDNAVKLLILE